MSIGTPKSGTGAAHAAGHTVEVLSGNQAAALAAKLCRPEVIAAYPITPQTPIVEYVAQYVADAELDASLCEVESEHSALSVLQGASLAGARTFTATSSQGLSLMYEPYFRTPTLRLPIVMAIVNREMISPQTVWGGPQDSLTLRDAGWIQLYAEDNQEILDTIIQAFRIAEDERVLLPVNVCFDGFYLSHMTERVEVPEAAEVDRFLPAGYRPSHIYLDPDRPMSVDPLTPGNFLTEYRQKQVEAMARAAGVIEEVDLEFGRRFGRRWGGLVEPYRLEDAEFALVTFGSMTGAARVAVDEARDSGRRVGLLKIRSLRPFPAREVVRHLGGLKAVGVVDRDVSFGWGTGIVYQEVRAALACLGRKLPAVPFIGGLGGEDLTVGLMCQALDAVAAAAAGTGPAGASGTGEMDDASLGGGAVGGAAEAPETAVWLLGGQGR